MPKKKSSRQQELLREHNLWLQRMGVKGKGKSKPKGIYSLPDLSAKSNATLSNSIGNGARREQPTYSGEQNLCVGLGYNKGNYVVLSKQEQADPATGKRRY